MNPEQMLYTKEHEWLHVTDDTATIGITDHAQAELGDIVFVELPEVGTVYGNGDEFGSVESVKAVAEVFMPLDGEVVAINDQLEDEPELVNGQPQGSGWLIKVRMSDLSQLDGLMDQAAYEAFCKEEAK